MLNNYILYSFSWTQNFNPNLRYLTHSTYFPIHRFFKSRFTIRAFHTFPLYIFKSTSIKFLNPIIIKQHFFVKNNLTSIFTFLFAGAKNFFSTLNNLWLSQSSTLNKSYQFFCDKGRINKILIFIEQTHSTSKSQYSMLRLHWTERHICSQFLNSFNLLFFTYFTWKS